MGIQRKIEEIRSKPEHIRMRYVLGSVFVSMLLISILWIFSIMTALRSQKKSDPPLEEMKPSMNQSTLPMDSNQSAEPSLNEWIKK